MSNTPPKPPPWDIPEWSVRRIAVSRVWEASAVVDGVRLTLEAEDVAKLRETVAKLRGQTLVVP